MTRQRIKDKTLIELYNEFVSADKLFYNCSDPDIYKDWDLKLKRLKRRLKSIKTGRVRWIVADQYKGHGEIRIKELDDQSLPVVSFHKSSLNKKYEANKTIAEFDYIEVEMRGHGQVYLQICGLK